VNYFQTTNSNTSEINLTSISSTISYRIIGFTGVSDRLRVNLRISSNTDLRHTDTLDLYLAKARNQLIRDTAKKLSVEASDVEKDIDELINYLEETEPLSTEENTMTESERSEAIKTLKSKQLFKHILKDFETCGYVGEEEAKLFGYIATVSRLLAKPLGILIVSRSGAGKSTLQEAITNFIPNEDLLSFTRITAQSLFYTEKDALKHKVLSIAEEDGMQDAIYSIRTLQSDQRLSISVTNNENGQMKTDENEVEGPVVIMITTTNPESLDYETRNRFVILTIDESREQTERILKIQRAADSLDGLINESNKPEIIKRHQNMQRLLKPVAVHNPYYDQLSFSADKLQMRREQKKYLTLIKSIALLRQYQKPTQLAETQSASNVEYISVDKTDIKLANQLAVAVLGRNLDELAPHSRTLVNDIVDLWQKSKLALNDYKFTMHELLANLNWSRWQLMQNMKQLIELEYVFVLSGGSQGRKTVYGLNYDGEADESGRFLNYILPIEKLKEPSL
jgi:hypothetical protein